MNDVDDLGLPSPSLLALMEQLEDMAARGRRLPFTANVILNEDELNHLIDRIRAALPDDLAAARDILDERDGILDGARDEAGEIMVTAEANASRVVTGAAAQAESLVAGHALVRAAEEQAGRRLEVATEQAATVRIEADRYVQAVMVGLEEQLSRTMTTVRKGLESLPEVPPPARHPRRRGSDGPSSGRSAGRLVPDSKTRSDR